MGLSNPVVLSDTKCSLTKMKPRVAVRYSQKLSGRIVKLLSGARSAATLSCSHKCTHMKRRNHECAASISCADLI